MIKFKCSCEMGEHSAPVDKYIIEPNASDRVAELLCGYKKICVVSDEVTHEILGEKIEKILEGEGKLFSKVILPKDSLPDYKGLGDILLHIAPPSADYGIFNFSETPDFILAVGSGTVNDLCRVVSFRLNLPYGIAGTAPSMDGYLSAGSPTLFDGSKATIKCTTPRILIADTEIMKDAPWDMLLAGIGDMFGKYTGILDWKLARDYKGEYFCEKIAGDVIEATNSCLKVGYELEKRSPDAIKSVMEGFAVTGLGMAFTGNSRPASGAEHIIAHAWELYDIEDGKRPNLHGLEVCEATLLVIEMYKLIYENSDDEHIKSLIEKYLGYFDAVEEFCVRMKVPMVISDAEKMEKSIFRALAMRDRYTILFYLSERGILEEYSKKAIQRLLSKREKLK